jgi:hypothetical protein
MVSSRHITVAQQDSFAFGFLGGPESRVGGNSNFRVALICVLRGRLASEEGLGSSSLNYDALAAFAVTGVTVRGDGIGKQRES